MQKPSKVKKTHGQITQALKALAKSEGKKPNDVYNQFFREAFLHELMRRHEGWVLKGGTNIYCRIPGARQTKDLDLYREEEPTSSNAAAEALVVAMNGRKIGPYTFEVNYKGSGVTGTVDSDRVDVSVVHGVNQRLISFGVDVSGDLQVTGSVESVCVTSSCGIVVDFMPQSFWVTSYPVANQIADKVCAMYERHGRTPPGKASTRYHDLYDVALIAKELTMSTGVLTAESLRMAIETQCQVRNMTLPKRITLPDESWVNQYPLKAKQFGDPNQGLNTLDEALRIVGLLVNPILAGEANGAEQFWNSVSLAWE